MKSTTATARGVLSSLALALVAAACTDAGAPIAPPAPVAAPATSLSPLFGADTATDTGERPTPTDLSDAGTGAPAGALRLERGGATAVASIGGTTATHYTLASITDAVASSAWAGAIVGVSQHGGAYQAAVETRPLGEYPTGGSSYLVVSSGDARTAGSDASFRATPCVGIYCDIGGLDLHVQVPAGATTMGFDYRMWSRDTVPYNDYFKVFVIDAAGVSHQILAHDVASDFVPGERGARLSHLSHTATIDVSAWAGQLITLRFETADAIDFGCATGALIDDLRFTVPGLTLTKIATDNATTVQPGSPISFTLEVTNTGNTTLEHVVLSDVLPAGLGVSWSIQPAATGCAITGTATQTLDCSFGTLAPGASRTVTVRSATVGASCGLYPNTASAAAMGLPATTADAQIVVPCGPPPAGICDGGVTKLVLKYIATEPLAGQVLGQRRNPGTSAILPAITTGFGATTLYTFAITPLGGQFTAVSNGRLANNFILYVGSTLIADFHTSCSAPIYPGMVLGGQFEIVEVYSKNGGMIGAP